MPMSSHTKNGMLNGLRNVAWQKAALFASAHNGAPGDTGANEISGGTPAYARKSITFGAPSAGSMATSAPVVIDVPTGTTVTHIGLWDASVAGNFLGFIDTVDEVFASQGTLTLNTGSTFDLNL